MTPEAQEPSPSDASDCTPKMRHAFVSHSTADDSIVAEMESFLRAAGLDEVFNDVSAIRPDEIFWPEIEKGIARADTFVAIISTASNASEWVRREVELARSLEKKIIPVWIDDCPVPPNFADRDVVDFRSRTRVERRFEISRIFKYAPAELIGREDETKLLNDAWQKALRAEKERPRVLTFVALGGEGKTSLVAKWAAELAHQDWPGCDAAFAWSFYSQGTRDQVAASSDLFLKEALTYFASGTKEEIEETKAFAASPAGAYEKGQRLARIVGQRRSILILDGLEPLQYAPTSPTPGQLKDQGVGALLKGLATTSRGLCIVTTRYSLPDLRAFWQTTAPEEKLLRLSRAAGVHLLQSFGVKGSPLRNLPLHGEPVNEFEKLVEDVQGHALTLNLLGTYLRDAHAGDIRKRDLVKLEEADAEEQVGHAFRVIEAYEREFEREGDKGQRALAVLRLLGLFDRPLTSDCLGALLRPPAIHGLTEALLGLTEAQRNLSFNRLENARLLTIDFDVSGSLTMLDAHPLLREYFARQLRTQLADTWRAAHYRLYCHLRGIPEDNQPDTLEDLQPLFQAVFHGCAAEEFVTTWSDYHNRIQRRHEYHATNQLGAYGADLGALACFFDQPWTRLSPEVPEVIAVFVLRQTAFSLRALIRLDEAAELARNALERARDAKNWLGATLSATILSDVQLLGGNIDEAIHDGELAARFADDQSEDDRRLVSRVFQANALHQAGRRSEALMLFQSAEEIQALRRPEAPLLQSNIGFHYCDLLIANVERFAWKQSLEFSMIEGDKLMEIDCQCLAISNRAAQSLNSLTVRGRDLSIGDIAISRLAIARSALLRALAHEPIIKPDSTEGGEVASLVEEALAGLRRSEQRNLLPAALLTRAWLRSLGDLRTGLESAQADLDEAWEIAERGPMRLHMADIHLYRARLFFREAEYPWESPGADLAAAEKLINECGYHRRDEELADAKAAIRSK